jgi:predicted ATPase
MAIIEGFQIKNYGPLRDITLGRLWSEQKNVPLTPLTAVIGKNGAGKSSLFDAFGFLADCLKLGVEEACDAGGRGGLKQIRSQGIEDALSFEIYYRAATNARPITYEMSIDLDDSDRPFVSQERLRQRRNNQSRGRPFSFLILKNGKGIVWKGDYEGIQDEGSDEAFAKLIDEANRTESNEKEYVELVDNRKLGISTLGALKQHPRIAEFRKFIEGWYLSYFTPDAARSLPLAGPQKHLNVHGENLGNVVQFMEREHPKLFQSVLDRIAAKIPGVEKIETETTQDSRLLLTFYAKGFDRPFYSQRMSDGTLKVFAYMLLLSDPSPHPFICIEEPENGVYNQLLETLATEFREHASSKKNGSQLFITTHQPYFVDALNPDELWILKKEDDGYSVIYRASDVPIAIALVEEGFTLGKLWHSDYLEVDSNNAL